jgi:predicted amidophosphoribosyltransferase
MRPWSLLLDALFPEACIACGEGLATPPHRLCAGCALPTLPRAAPIVWPLGGAWSLGRYDEVVGMLVRRGKYRPDASCLLQLGRRLGEAAAGRLPQVDLVIPAPSAWPNRWRRGFEPAALLAGPVAQRLGKPCLHRLHRAPAESQASRGRQDRLRSARRLIQATGAVSGRVLLVDDVLTTGATAGACAEALLEAGAKRVYLLTAAATLKVSDSESQDSPL